MKRRTLSILIAVALCLCGCGKEDVPAFVTGESSQTDRVDQADRTEQTANTIGTGSATQLYDQVYTNVPGVPTQKAVLDYTFSCLTDAGEEKSYPVCILEPDALTVESLEDIYRFVQEEDKMPVRYFPENVQEQVQEILDGGSVDILHISEFFGICPEIPEERAVSGRVQLDTDYRVGQLVVVMFGDTTGVNTENLNGEELKNIQWTPLPAQVKKQGQIMFEVPQELLKAVEGERTLFLVLTVRPGGDGDANAENQADGITGFIPSKDSGDLTDTNETITSADGSVLPDDFRIFIREHTMQSREEINRLQRFMEQQKDTIASYFSESLQREMALLLDDAAPGTLVCYNANYLGAENYVETYGDAVAGFRFPTDYPENTEMVCLLGTQRENIPETQSSDPVLPEESAFAWTALRAEVKDGYVFITFPQQLLPIMEQQGALVLVLSQPITSRG